MAPAEWFPSEEWLAAYRANLNASDRYRAASEGWGVGFEGDFVFEIRELPLAETTVGALPDQLVNRVRGSLASLPDERVAAIVADAPPPLAARLEGIVEEDASERERLAEGLLGATVDESPSMVGPAFESALPGAFTNLLSQLDGYVDDGAVRVHLDLHDGECRSAEVLEPDAAPEPGFALRGPYEHWRDLVGGADVMESVLGEALELDGSVTTVVQYADAAQEMGDVANRTPSRPLF